MSQLPWVFAGILALLTVEIALAFTLQVVRGED